MQLGQILDSQEGVSCVGEEVTFWLNVKDSSNRWIKRQIKALLYPVSAPEKTDVLRQAEQYLRTRPDWSEKDGKLPPIPAYVVSNEVDIRFLFAALRDADDPGRPLVEVANYERFRLGLVDQTIDALTKAHAAFMASEYPEIVSATDMRKLEEQAKGK